MRFVPVKSAEQQAILSLHRVRQGFIEQRTATINRIRGLLAEFGVVLPQRAEQVRRAAVVVAEELPLLAREAIADLRAHLTYLDERISRYERQLVDPGADSGRRRYAFSACRELGRSPPRRSPPASATGTNSPMVGSLQRGWDWCRDSTRPAAKRDWGASPNAATPTCARS